MRKFLAMLAAAVLLVSAARDAFGLDEDRPQIVYVTLTDTPGDVVVHWISSDLQPVRSTVAYRWVHGVVAGSAQGEHVAAGQRVELASAHGRRYWVHHVPLQLRGVGVIEFSIPTSDRKWQYRQRQSEDDRAFVLPDNTLKVAGEFRSTTAPMRVAIAGDLGRDGDNVEAALAEVGRHRPDVVVLAGNFVEDHGEINERYMARWLELLDALTTQLADDRGRLPALVALPGLMDIDEIAPRDAERARWVVRLFPQITKLPYAVPLNWALRLVLLDAGWTQTAAAQADWLRSTLRDPAFDGFTVPIYCESMYPGAKKFDSVGSLVLRRHWAPAFDEAAIELAVEHADRAYKRSQPMFLNRPATGGTTYVGGGGMGRKQLEDVAPPGDGGLLSSRRNYLVKSEKIPTFTLLQATPPGTPGTPGSSASPSSGGVPCTPKVSAIADDGRVVDSFTLIKGEPARVTPTYVSKPHERATVWILVGVAVVVVLVWLLLKD